MGNVYSETEFQEIIKVCEQLEITILVDEAYHYFYPKTFIKYAFNSKHILVTRTFSKLFSMAGCRLGYVVGHPDEIKMVQNLTYLIENYNLGRDYLVKELDTHGYLHKGDAGNFIFIKPKTDAVSIVDKMKSEKQILIKSYSNVGNFGTCLRVTIGARQYMERFLDALFELDNIN